MEKAVTSPSAQQRDLDGFGAARSRQAILFDTFGTLVDWRSSLIEMMAEFGRARALEADWTGLTDRWRSEYKPSLDRVRQGEIGWTLLDELHKAALRKLLPEFALRHLPETDIDFLTHCWHRLKPWPDTVPGLIRIKQRFLIGPLSNGNLSLMVDLAKYAGLPWDVVFGSDLFLHYKPDPETYLGACKLLDLEPAQVMLAAAHNDDLEAARRLGLKTAFVPRPTEYGPRQTGNLRAEAAWDIVATDVMDLAIKLEQ